MNREFVATLDGVSVDRSASLLCAEHARFKTGETAGVGHERTALHLDIDGTRTQLQKYVVHLMIKKFGTSFSVETDLETEVFLQVYDLAAKHAKKRDTEADWVKAGYVRNPWHGYWHRPLDKNGFTVNR
jgi:hypothetical protein